MFTLTMYKITYHLIRLLALYVSLLGILAHCYIEEKLLNIINIQNYLGSNSIKLMSKNT